MVFGLLKDIKNGEYRTIATPGEIATIVADGHTALVQRGAGATAGFADEAYEKAGAKLVDTMEEIYAQCDFVTKVKELEPCEFPLLREGQIIFTCIHPAAHPEEVQAILDSKCIAFTAEDCHRYGSPNCEAAGKQGALFGLESMLSINGGKGKFVSGLGGAPAMRVLILGGGVGNLIDRIRLGYVVDMFHFQFWPSYPVFNVADIFVVAGVILFLLYYLFLYEKTDGKKNRSKPDDRKGAQD